MPRELALSLAKWDEVSVHFHSLLTYILSFFSAWNLLVPFVIPYAKKSLFDRKDW
jgi:hypothetical protein